MRTYKIKVSYTFTGTVEVRAANRERAKEITNRDFGAVSPSYQSSNLSNDNDEEGVRDWNCGVHPDKTKVK